MIAVYHIESGICKPALFLRRFQFRGKRPCAKQLSVAHKIAADQQGIRAGFRRFFQSCIQYGIYFLHQAEFRHGGILQILPPYLADKLICDIMYV